MKRTKDYSQLRDLISSAMDLLKGIVINNYDYIIEPRIYRLVEISKQFDDMATVRKMKQIVPEYKSNNSKYEAIDKELAEGK